MIRRHQKLRLLRRKGDFPENDDLDLPAPVVPSVVVRPERESVAASVSEEPARQPTRRGSRNDE